MSCRAVICECFARDGLQSEAGFMSTGDKIRALSAFATAGFQRIEATSYSHPARVEAFRDASAVLAGIPRTPGVAFKATCPNAHAVRRALNDLANGHGADELSLLVSATESHSQRNLRASRDQQWRRVEEMARLAEHRFRLVGVISMALGCNVEGSVDAGRIADDVGRFADLGITLVTIGDTAGLATPITVRRLLTRLRHEYPDVTPVAHFHDCRGTGLANAVAALEAGCTYFDSAFGGVGGHPAGIDYGADFNGNIATEDLVNLFESMGVDTGLDLDRILSVSRLCEQLLGRTLLSTVARAGWGLVGTRGVGIV